MLDSSSRAFPDEEGTESFGRAGRARSRRVPEPSPMKRGLKENIKTPRMSAGSGVRGSYPMKRRSKRYSNARCAPYCALSRAFPYEEGTERLIDCCADTSPSFFPEPSPMKRGLKESHTTTERSSSLVPEPSPMKRGQKAR